MPGHVFLEGSRLVLRPVEQSQLDRAVLGYVRNHPSFRYALGFDAPWPEERVRQFVESVTMNESSYNLFICLPEGDRSEDGRWSAAKSMGYPTIGGAVNLFDVDRTKGTLSYWLFDKHRGNGYATEAVALLIDYAFDELGLHRIEAETFEGNDASRSLLEELGFVHEGVARECRFAGNGYEDTHRFGLLQSDWARGENAR